MQFVIVPSKGHIKPKADWRTVDSLKKRRTNLFSLFFCFSRQTKQIQIGSFFWENLWRAIPALSLYDFLYGL